MLLEGYWPTTWTRPLGPIWNMIHSHTEELEILITKYKKVIAYQNQVTIATRYDTDQIVKTATGFEQTSRHH